MEVTKRTVGEYKFLVLGCDANGNLGVLCSEQPPTMFVDITDEPSLHRRFPPTVMLQERFDASQNRSSP